MPVDCKIPTETEVNKLKIFPGNRDLVFCKYNNVEIFNWTSFDNRGSCHNPDRQKVAVLDCCDSEGWGMNISELSYKIFTSNNNSVYIFDLQGHQFDKESVFKPIQTTTVHSNQVNDETPTTHNPYIWVSVSDDKTMVVNDLRCEDKHVIDFAPFGDKNELNAVDNNPYEEHL